MTKCRSCGAEIIWAETVNGKKIPLDAQPRLDGALALSPRGTVVTIGPDPCPGYDDQRFVSHFATCKDAPKWRRPKE